MATQTRETPINNTNEGPSEVPGPSELTTENLSSPSGSNTESTPTKKCDSCRKPVSDPEKPLKACPKCQSAHYCSRECQKADFKKHKKVCAEKAQIYAMGADLKMSAPRVPKKEGHRGGLQKWQFDT